MLQKLNKKLSRNQKGFSLIELMVAVAILAFAIFGIFRAYSVGFMGMADAKERTVATNYMREALENVKNMDFDKIATTTRSVIDGNKRYRIDVNLIEETKNYKKVYTVVSWKDRSGETKTVNSSLTVNFIEVFASDAAKVVLFTESYAILNTPTTSPDASTEVIAVIKDINGNTVTEWNEGDITFENISLTAYGVFPGGLFSINVTPVEGRASTTFTSLGTYDAALAPTDDYFVLQEISASVYLPDADMTVKDTITIKITDGPVKIDIDADPKSVKAEAGSYSTITASVINASGAILNKSGIFNDLEITFNAYDEGRFENGSSTYSVIVDWNSDEPSEPATVTLNLYSTGSPGYVNIVATSTNLESGSTSMTFLGPPEAISISVAPNPIYEDDTGGSEIKVVLLDSNDHITSPIDSTVDVTLTGTDNGTGGNIGGGDLVSLTFNVDDYEKTTTFSGQNSTGTYVIDASATGLTGASVTINVISAIVPHHIKLEVVGDDTIPADGSTPAHIKATVCDESGKIVTAYAGTLTFETTIGIFTNNGSNLFVASTTNGVATVDLASSNSGTAIITVSSSDSLPSDPVEGVEVKFYGTADHIELKATPDMVKADGIAYSTITATICDDNGTTVTDYSGSVTFSTNLGTFSTDTMPITNGIATTKLYSNETGIATIAAQAGVLTQGSTEVEFYEETTLTLVEGSTKYEGAGNLIITFDVRITGEAIEIDEMKITWTNSGASERYSGIEIESLEVWSGNSKSDTTADISNTTLSPGETSIKLTFKQSMTGKYPIAVIFYPPVSGWYEISLNEPS